MSNNKLMLETCPEMFGQELYPYGLYIKHENIFVNVKPLTNVLIDCLSGEATELETELACSYLRYVLAAPCWEGITDEIKKKAANLNFDDLFEYLLDFGIDPI